MSTKSLVVTALGAATVVAAGAGSFIALRMNAANRPVAAEAAAVQAPVPPAVIGTSVAVEPPASPAAPSAPVNGAPVATKAEPAVKAPAAATNSRTPAEPAQVERRAPRPGSPAASAPAPRVTTAPPAPEPTPAGTSSAPNTPPASSPSANTPPATIPPPAPPATVTTQPDPLPPPPPAKPRFEELTIGENAVIGIRLETALSSATARVEDRVTARVSRDVTVDGRTAIPAGAKLEGTVVAVEKGGKFKDRARLGVRFTSVVLADNLRVPLQTETIFRDGESPTPDATSKIGASAVVGAILGAVIGGKKGAAIGGSAGAAGGTAVVMNSDGNPATMAAGSPLTVRLTAPVTVTIDKDPNK